MSDLGSLITLEYGEALPASIRTGHGFPVFGSNGEVGRHSKFLVPELGIIVGRKGSVGKITWSDEPFWPIDTTYWVNCAPEDRRWLYWVLNWLPLARLDSSTGVPGLNRNDVYELSVDRPRLIERQKIALILDTLDTPIHETEVIIAKLKAVKQGLLHDLLTRGIDANGELRPPRDEAPHLYKQSPLGRTPKEWEVLALGDVADSLVDGPFGSNLKTVHYVENPGVRVVRLQNILPGEYDDSERAFISERHAASLSRNRVVGGDVLIASLGDANYPVGRSCCYPTELPDAVNKADCFRFRASKRCRNKFVMLSMNGAAVRKQVRGYEQGVTMKRINLGNLRRIGIALPSIFEQDLIVERLQAAQQQVEIAALEHQKLRGEKSGLMDDLLTGRVRVTPLLAEAQEGGA